MYKRKIMPSLGWDKPFLLDVIHKPLSGRKEMSIPHKMLKHFNDIKVL